MTDHPNCNCHLEPKRKMTARELLGMPHLKAVKAGYKWYTFKVVSVVQVEYAHAFLWNLEDAGPLSPLNGSDDQFVTHDYWMTSFAETPPLTGNCKN